MQMEVRGVPCVTVTSSVFTTLAEHEAKAFNMPDLKLVQVPHPVATRPDEELRELAAGLLGPVLAALTTDAETG